MDRDYHDWLMWRNRVDYEIENEKNEENEVNTTEPKKILDDYRRR